MLFTLFEIIAWAAAHIDETTWGELKLLFS